MSATLSTLVDTRDPSATPMRLTDAIRKSQPESGGLFVPRAADIPRLGEAELRALVGKNYHETAYVILSHFDLGLSADALQQMIASAYGSQWHHTAITPVTPLAAADKLFILELGHGPTFAFKNVALEFLGRYLSKMAGTTTLRALGASSGDTVNAAHYAVAGSPNLRSIFLLPKDGPSPVQRLQALQHGIPNALTILIDGDFDDAQAAIKRFNAPDYATWKAERNLISFNSIQILRVLAQIVYYFRAYATLVENNAIQFGDAIDFSVPSGNFGDILAGEFARRMGLPIRKLNIATNANDILHRFLATGRYEIEKAANGARVRAKITLAPSQDITISSNFERALFWAAGEDATRIAGWMNDLKTMGGFMADDSTVSNLRALYTSSRADDESIISTRKWAYEQHGVIVDPHTATGIAPFVDKKPDVPTVCLSTSHALQFPDVAGAPNTTEYADLLNDLKKNPPVFLTSQADEQSIFAAANEAIAKLEKSA